MAKVVGSLSDCNGHGFQSLVGEVQQRLQEYKPYNLTTISWSLAKLAYYSSPLFDAISGAALAKLPEFDTRRLARMVWAFARIVVVD